MKKILATALVTVSCAACSVQTIGAPKGGLEFEAEFTDVQSLVVGHSVQMSDVRIGTVTGIKLDRDFKAHVTMQLEPGRRLPAGVTASVAKTSLLGENYIKITLPQGETMNSTPTLPAHAVITQTSVQPDLESISEKVGPVLAAFGGQDLSEIVDALATALKDKGPELNELIAHLADVSQVYAGAAQDLTDVIDGLARLGSALAAKEGELDALPGRINLATDRIEADKTELKDSVQELVKLSDSFNDLIQVRHAARLHTVLARLERMLKAMERGRTTLKQLMQTLYSGLLAQPSVTYKGQGLMHVWLAGFLGFDTDATHVTANQGKGEYVDLTTDAERALSPIGGGTTEGKTAKADKTGKSDKTGKTGMTSDQSKKSDKTDEAE